MGRCKKLRVSFEHSETGVSIWINGFWVLDASTFANDLSFIVDRKKFKMEGSDFPGGSLVFTLKR